MENASKALIIAGAILLAILLISLGIMIFNRAQDTVEDSGMSEAEITAFNSKFMKYEGDQKGTLVKALVQEVIASNNSTNSGAKVEVTGVSDGKSTSGIINNNTYTVTLKYEGKNGRVNEIEIKNKI